MFMMLVGRLGFESGGGGRKALCKGIKVGRTTAVEARDENRVKLTKMNRLMMLSRLLSMMSIKHIQVRGVAIFTTPRFACTAVFYYSSARSRTCVI